MDNMFFRRLFDEAGTPDPLLITSLIIIGAVVLVISITILILFLLSLYKNLNSISEKNRKMSSGLVWLNLIPCFSLGWMIYTVLKIKESNELEFKDKNITYTGDFGYGIGLAFAILNLVNLGTSFIIPFIGSFPGIASFVCWIIYWVNISKLTKLLIVGNINSSETNNINSNI